MTSKSPVARLPRCIVLGLLHGAALRREQSETCDVENIVYPPGIAYFVLLALAAVSDIKLIQR
ncbi:MAG: hypothetical protein AAF483_06350 [Planctomycetota bacterium]